MHQIKHKGTKIHKKTTTSTKSHIDPKIVIVGIFNTVLLQIGMPPRHKLMEI